jgi:glycosyltransferase involved in cell wall biosynthesis
LAMSMGKPIIAPSMPGITELVGTDSFLFGEHGIADALQRATAARGEWERIGQASLRRVRAHRWDAALDAILEAP